jgi:protein-tyrosine-phosphatase
MMTGTAILPAAELIRSNSVADHDIGRPLKILFLSRRGAARSVMAAAITRRVSADRLRGVAAAVYPDPIPDPFALQLLRNHGYDISDVPLPQHYAAFTGGPEAGTLDFVFTLSDTAAGEAPPEWPGHPITAHWSCPDAVRAAADTPSIAERGIIYTEAYAVLERRLRIFAALPFPQLSRIALQKQVESIGDQI